MPLTRLLAVKQIFCIRWKVGLLKKKMLIDDLINLTTLPFLSGFCSMFSIVYFLSFQSRLWFLEPRPSFEFLWLWIFPWIKLSWHSCSLWARPEWLNWFWQFLCEGYLPLNRKDCSTPIHGLAVYVKEGLRFARDLSLENSADSYLCFRLTLLHSVF